MKTFLVIISAVIISTNAIADNYVRCTYRLPHLPNNSFVEEKSDVNAWLERMKGDKSLQDWETHPACGPLDRDKRWYLLTKTENGYVSISGGNLTEDQCQTLVHKFTDPRCNNCIYQIYSSTITDAECFK